jgi:protein-S-isoprenylcysteine O-methyltransferase Ste14
MSKAFRMDRTLMYALLFFMWRYVAIQAMTIGSRLNLPLPAWMKLIAFPLLIIEILIMVFCLIEFVAVGKGSFVHFDAPTKFVATAIYKYVRNPMYLGVFLIFLGYAFLNQSISVLILATTTRHIKDP